MSKKNAAANQMVSNDTHVTVGVGANIPCMSMVAGDGKRHGFDVDFGRALAAVLFCDTDAVEFTTIDPTDRFKALRDGRIDVGFFNASCTLQRELINDVVFPAVNLFDGEGVLIRRSLGVSSLRELDRPVIAAQRGTTTRANLECYLRGYRYQVDEFSTLNDAFAAYDDQSCDVLVFDSIILASLRLKLPTPADHIILDERLSREAMGPAVLGTRPNLIKAVRWTVNALILAEEAELTRETLSDLNPDADDSPAARLLRNGLALHPDDELAVDRLRSLISGVGNYGEIFDRHLGLHSPLKVPRGPNAPFARGGAFLPPPLN